MRSSLAAPVHLRHALRARLAASRRLGGGRPRVGRRARHERAGHAPGKVAGARKPAMALIAVADVSPPWATGGRSHRRRELRRASSERASRSKSGWTRRPRLRSAPAGAAIEACSSPMADRSAFAWRLRYDAGHRPKDEHRPSTGLRRALRRGARRRARPGPGASMTGRSRAGSGLTAVPIAVGRAGADLVFVMGPVRTTPGSGAVERGRLRARAPMGTRDRAGALTASCTGAGLPVGRPWRRPGACCRSAPEGAPFDGVRLQTAHGFNGCRLAGSCGSRAAAALHDRPRARARRRARSSARRRGRARRRASLRAPRPPRFVRATSSWLTFAATPSG